MYLKEMTPSQLHQAVEQNWPLLIPAGCIEYHGPHLPLGTDTLIAEEICKRLAKRINVVIAPSFEYGSTGYALSGPALEVGRAPHSDSETDDQPRSGKDRQPKEDPFLARLKESEKFFHQPPPIELPAARRGLSLR